jgi:hypothetical protein
VDEYIVERDTRESAQLEAEKNLKAALCTDEIDQAFLPVVNGTDSGGVLVAPSHWRKLDFKSRKVFAQWVSTCYLHSGAVSIRHGATGRELALFSPEYGYQSKE